MNIALYCPNKPLTHANPSGDLTIAEGIRKSLILSGHDCREIIDFRSRWFWKSVSGWNHALSSAVQACANSRRYRPDLWLTYHTYYKSPDIIGPWLSRLLDIPYILFQPMYSTRRRKNPHTRLGFYLNQIALKTAEHVFINNNNDMEAISRILPSSRVTYLRPGIFPEKFGRNAIEGQIIRRSYNIPDDSPLIMTAARFRPGVKFQSIVYLLKSLALLKGRGNPFQLLIVGDGAMDDQIHKLAELILPGSVVFAGRVRHDEMFRYYSAADIFAYPGIGESLGMVFLEAQACGLPVVALDTAGVPQVVSKNETGILVPQDDGATMADAIETLLSDSEMRKRLSLHGPRHVLEKHNLHVNYRRLIDKLTTMGRRTMGRRQPVSHQVA